MCHIITSMKQIDFRNGSIRAGITFVLVLLTLMLLFWMLGQTFNINFFAETILVLIGAGWAAYYVWRKTELGYYR